MMFLTEAEKLPCHEASLTLGTRCLMISKRPITPCAPGSKQRGKPGEETEQTPGEETAQVVVFSLAPGRMINGIFF